MIRKALYTVAGVSLLSVLFFGRDATSYVCTTFGWMKDSVKSAVPIEFEIERARRMVRDLVPDIRKNMHVIAQEEVEIERLDKQIAQTSTTMDRDKAEIMKLKTDLGTVQPVYHYGGHSYSVQQVKVDLANRFERFKIQEATLTSLRDLQAQRRKSLDAARQKLEGMLVNRRRLEVDVASLEARFKTLEVTQTMSEHNIDDSQLGRVKDLIADVRTRLTVAERLAQTAGNFDTEIQISSPQSDNIVEQVTEYFANPAGGTQVADAQPGAPAAQ